MSPPTVLSLGSIAADFQVRIDSVEDFGRALRPARELARFSGGKAANRAVLAHRQGCDALLLGRVGDDDLAEQALAPLRAEGVALHGVRRARGERTGFALLAVGPAAAKRSLASGEANFGFDDADVQAIAAAIEAAPDGSVLSADYEITSGAVSRAIAAARSRGFPVVVDPSFPHLVQRADLQGVTALTPNEREARALAGSGDAAPLAEVARALQALGAPAVCIKLDGGGCLLLHEGVLCHQHAAPTQPVDTSGAGDAFTAMIAVALARGCAMREAVLLAVVATELVVAAYGAQPGCPDRARLEARLQGGGARLLTPWGD